jgi:hypothetical protein
MKTKSFLALKAVSVDNTSCHATNPFLKTLYSVGNRITTKYPTLPYFIATKDEISYPPTTLSVATGYYKLLLISVLAKDIRTQSPWLNSNVSGGSYFDYTKEQVYFESSFITATSLRVLETVPVGANLHNYLKAQAAKYHQKVLTRSLAFDVGQKIVVDR